MTIEAQWSALESESGGNLSGGWRLRLVRPVGGHPLFTALFGGRRYLLLRTIRSSIPPRADWPDCVGLELQALELDGHAYFGVALREPRFTDVFSALAEDLARRIELADPVAAIAVFTSQLGRWRSFLAATTEGLGVESQRGLWGELHLLLNVLEPELGNQSVAGWKGPQASHQDFRYSGAWIEVKTTFAKQPQTVRITSERQLDDSHAPALFLHVLTLEAIEGGDDTLPALVAQARTRFASWPEALERFEEALLSARYLDQHAPRYSGIGYSIRRVDTFRVTAGFPRIVEQDLAPGVGDASYSLSLSACMAFSTSIQDLIAILKTSTASC